MNISFKSSLAPTDFLKSGFDYSIARGYKGHEFLDAVNTILNDGKNDVIKIDGVRGSEMKMGEARRHDIFVNNRKVVNADYSPGLIFDGPQCVTAIVGFAKKRSGKLQESVYSALDSVYNTITASFESCMSHEKPKYDKALENIKFIKKQQEGSLTKDLIDTKNKIFG